MHPRDERIAADVVRVLVDFPRGVALRRTRFIGACRRVLRPTLKAAVLAVAVIAATLSLWGHPSRTDVVPRHAPNTSFVNVSLWPLRELALVPPATSATGGQSGAAPALVWVLSLLQKRGQS